MIRVLADENMAGLKHLPADSIELVTKAGRAIDREDLRGIDALWVRSVTQVDAALLEGSSLKFVGTATAGLEHVDVAYLREQRIDFAAAPGANANAVTEYVLAALWNLESPWRDLEEGGELAIVGMGAVGRRIAAVARAMGWSVRCCDPYLGDEVDGFRLEHLEALLDCSVLSLHPSLNTTGPWPSYHLLDASMLKSLRGGQTLINASRGPVIDNRALVERLRGEKPPTVVLDVWEGEPVFDDALLKNDSLRIATPHIAGYSAPAKAYATCMLWNAMIDFGLLDAVELEDLIPFEDSAYERLSGVMGVDELFAATYRIAEDDRRFRALTGLSEAERSAGFDQLRKHYPQRLEISGLPLADTAELTPSARRLYQALTGH